MKFEKISKLKDYFLEKAKNYQGEDGERNISFNLSIGNKRVDLGIFEYSVDANTQVALKRRQLQIFSANLVDKIDGVLFVKLNVQKGHKSAISKEIFSDALSFVTDYWVAYQETQKMAGIFFDYSWFLGSHDALNAYFQEKNMEQYSKYRGIVFIKRTLKGPYFNFEKSVGKLNEDKKNKYECIMNIEQQIEQMKKEDPTIISKELLEKEVKSNYRLANIQFCWKKEFFMLEPIENNLKFSGHTMGERLYSLEETSIPKVFQDILEHGRLENLFHPSIVNIKAMFEHIFNKPNYVSYLEKTILELDALIGEGETEKELYYVNMELKEVRYNKRQTNKVKEMKSNVFEFYKVKTNKYFWFVLIDLMGDKHLLTCNETGDLPENVMERMKVSIGEFFTEIH